ncbi:MAG TPA: hypothetical protein VH370_17230 [Humisphaera sp.]|jgi:integrase|nr:hypothetical protein [Humisphaera sp.]
MAKPNAREPGYRLHKHSKQAYVYLGGRQHRLGPYGTEASKQKFHRLIAEWHAGGRRLPDLDDGPTVTMVLEAFWEHAKKHYSKKERDNFRSVVRYLRRLYGLTPAKEFGPVALMAWRDSLISPATIGTAAHKGWCRTFANKQANRVKRIFKWACSRQLLPITVHQALTVIEPLRRGRTEAREAPAVLPADEELILAAIGNLPSPLRAMVELQELTGIRGGELTIMRAIDIDRSDPEAWIYRPSEHKNKWRGDDLDYVLPPDAQAILAPFLKDRMPAAYLFSPRDAQAERHAKRHAERKTPAGQGNGPGTNRAKNPTRPPGDHYTPDSYRRAIHYALTKAFPPPKHLARSRIESKKKGGRWESDQERRQRLGQTVSELAQWIKRHRFSPHALRHNAATRTEKEHGHEGSSAFIRHKTPDTTKIYIERNLVRAKKIAAQQHRITSRPSSPTHKLA